MATHLVADRSNAGKLIKVIVEWDRIFEASVHLCVCVHNRGHDTCPISSVSVGEVHLIPIC